MELTIHTYGYYDAIYYVLNGIAMLRNSDFYSTLLQTVTVLVGCYYGIRAAYSSSYSTIRQYVLKALGMLALLNGLLMPTTEMLIRDHVGKKIGKVDNIPLAFALPVGVLEEFGHLLTVGFEQVYAPIESAVNPAQPVFSYYNYGMLFGARLKKELRQVRIKDPEFVENMRSFIKQCVVMPSMIGHQFTPKQLLDSPDMWRLVSSKAGTLTRLYIRVGDTSRNVTCTDAAGFFESYFDQEIKRVIAKNNDTEFGQARGGSTYGHTKSALSSVFEKNISSLYSDSMKAGDILRQQMMINSISDYTSSNYAVARARTSQESGWLLSSDMASLYLPMLLVVIKSIVYASFMFLVPLLIFSGGPAKYTSYLTLVASLQLWPSLNAIINMIMGTYSNLKTGSDLMLSFSSASTVTNHVDTIVTVAAGLQMVVPFLAFALMQGGVSGLSHLAGSVIGGLQATGGSVGGEVASGNRSIDNVSEGNVQRQMRSGYKTDYNMQYVEGVNGWQEADGSSGRLNPDGSVIYTGGQGITSSSGSVKFNLEQSRQNQVNEGIQTSESLLRSDQRSLSDATSKTFSKTADFITNLAMREHNGESFNYDQLGEQGKSVQLSVETAKQLQQKYGYGWQQAGEMATKGSMSLSTPGNGVLGFGVSGSIEGSLRATNSSDQTIGEDYSINRGNNASDKYDNLVKAAANKSWAKDNSLDTSNSEAVRSSYEEQQRLEKQVSMRQESVDNWHSAKSKLDSEGASSSKDVYQEVLDRCVIEFGMDPSSVRRMIDRGDPDVMKVWNKMVNENISGSLPEINAGRTNISGHNAERNLDDFSSSSGKAISQDQDQRLKESIEASGNNFGNIRQSIEGSKEKLEGHYNRISGENENKYKDIRGANELEAKDLQKQVDKYEEDRIGQGRTAKVAAYALDKVSVGTAGKNIGGPGKNSRNNNGLNNGAYQSAGQVKQEDK